MIPFYWQDATTYLTRTDEVMAGLIVSYPDAVLLNHDNPFSTLMRAVVGQQISVKAADAIWQRLSVQLETISASPTFGRGNRQQATGNSKDFWGDCEIVSCLFPRPTNGSEAPPPWGDCVGRGLNPRPMPSLLPVACSLLPLKFLTIGEDQLRQCGLSRQKISYITAIARAFSEGTLTPSRWERMSDEEVVSQLVRIRGIGKWTASMFLIFHLNRPDVLPLTDLGLLNAIQLHYGNLSASEILKLSQRWQPYRTVATWYLWRSLDPVTVQY